MINLVTPHRNRVLLMLIASLVYGIVGAKGLTASECKLVLHPMTTLMSSDSENMLVLNETTISSFADSMHIDGASPGPISANAQLAHTKAGKSTILMGLLLNLEPNGTAIVPPVKTAGGGVTHTLGVAAMVLNRTCIDGEPGVVVSYDTQGFGQGPEKFLNRMSAAVLALSSHTVFIVRGGVMSQIEMEHLERAVQHALQQTHAEEDARRFLGHEPHIEFLLRDGEELLTGGACNTTEFECNEYLETFFAYPGNEPSPSFRMMFPHTTLRVLPTVAPAHRGYFRKLVNGSMPVSLDDLNKIPGGYPHAVARFTSGLFRRIKNIKLNGGSGRAITPDEWATLVRSVVTGVNGGRMFDWQPVYAAAIVAAKDKATSGMQVWQDTYTLPDALGSLILAHGEKCRDAVSLMEATQVPTTNQMYVDAVAQVQEACHRALVAMRAAFFRRMEDDLKEDVKSSDEMSPTDTTPEFVLSSNETTTRIIGIDVNLSPAMVNPAKGLHVVADTVTIQENTLLHLPGQSVDISCRVLRAGTNVTINVDGKTAVVSWSGPATDATEIGLTGSAGKDGDAGLDSGSVSLRAEQFDVEGASSLEVFARGGYGSDGQKGGRGGTGRDGANETGEPGLAGGTGGSGGCGGRGGRGGKVSLRCDHAKSENALKVTMDCGSPGNRGNEGSGGHGGTGGTGRPRESECPRRRRWTGRRRCTVQRWTEPEGKNGPQGASGSNKNCATHVCKSGTYSTAPVGELVLALGPEYARAMLNVGVGEFLAHRLDNAAHVLTNLLHVLDLGGGRSRPEWAKHVRNATMLYLARLSLDCDVFGDAFTYVERLSLQQLHDAIEPQLQFAAELEKALQVVRDETADLATRLTTAKVAEVAIDRARTNLNSEIGHLDVAMKSAEQRIDGLLLEWQRGKQALVELVTAAQRAEDDVRNEAARASSKRRRIGLRFIANVVLKGGMDLARIGLRIASLPANFAEPIRLLKSADAGILATAHSFADAVVATRQDVAQTIERIEGLASENTHDVIVAALKSGDVSIDFERLMMLPKKVMTSKQTQKVISAMDNQLQKWGIGGRQSVSSGIAQGPLKVAVKAVEAQQKRLAALYGALQQARHVQRSLAETRQEHVNRKLVLEDQELEVWDRKQSAMNVPLQNRQAFLAHVTAFWKRELAWAIYKEARALSYQSLVSPMELPRVVLTSVAHLANAHRGIILANTKSLNAQGRYPQRFVDPGLCFMIAANATSTMTVLDPLSPQLQEFLSDRCDVRVTHARARFVNSSSGTCVSGARLMLQHTGLASRFQHPQTGQWHAFSHAPVATQLAVDCSNSPQPQALSGSNFALLGPFTTWRHSLTHSHDQGPAEVCLSGEFLPCQHSKHSQQSYEI